MNYLINEGKDDVEYEEPRRKVSAFKEKEAQLLKDFQVYSMPMKIKERAAQIYMMVLTGDTFKRGRRRAMMCKCTYEAFKENNMPQDPVLLAAVFDIDVKKLRDAQDEFYSRIFGTDLAEMFPKRHLTAKELIPSIALAMGAEPIDLEFASVLIDKLYESSILMSRTTPRDIAIAFVHWYMNKNGQATSPTTTQTVTRIPKVKLTKLVSALESLIR